MEPNASAEDIAAEEAEVMEDTQERSDALAAEADVEETTAEVTSADEETTAEHAEPLEPALEETTTEETTPVENINTSDDLQPGDAGEVGGPPMEAAHTVEDDTAVDDSSETVEASDETDDTDDTVGASDETDDTDETTDEAAAEDATSAETEEPAPRPKFKRGDLLEGTITSTSPTSVTVALPEGVEGTIPGRELERMTRGDIEELQEGKTIKVFVVNPHDHQGNTVLSINRAVEETDWQRAEQFRTEQTVYDGRIAGYNKGGLIVRFGRLRGFVPQSQISDQRRRNAQGETPDERYSGMVNDEITVKVMEVDRSRNRLILSERAATRERRERRKEELIEEISVGQVIDDARVVSLEDFGAFVDIGGAEGLVHLTEIAWKHVTHPKDRLNVGDRVKVEVISVDPQRKRIGLSIKRQEADPWDEVATTYQVGDLAQATVTKLTKFGAFARLVDAEDIEGLIHISELSDQRVNHPREVVNEGEKLTLRVVKIDVKNRRLGLSLKRVNSAEYLDRDLETFASEADD